MVADGHTVTGEGRCRRLRACGAQSRIRRAADLFLRLALLCTWSSAMAAHAVDIGAVVGFADTLHPWRWTPLSVTVTNHGGDIRGDLEVAVTSGDALHGRVTFHRRPLELHRDSSKTLQFTVHLQGLSHPLVIRVRSAGREVARSEVDLRTRFIAERLLLVLSRDANLDYLNDSAANGLKVIYPHPEQLPGHWRGYDAVAAVVVHGVSLERLSRRQFDALHKWIAQGGVLAVSGGPDYALLRSPRLAALLPGVPSGLTRIDAGALHRAFSPSLDASRPVHINRLDAFHGRARLSSGTTRLIVERTLGLGRVLYLTFDVAGYPFDRWDGMRGLWLAALRLPPLARISLTGDKSTLESPLQPLIHAESEKFPAYATVFFFLALYLGVLLAAHALPLQPTRSRWPATLRGWAPPLLFAPAAWSLFGPPVFPSDATAVTVAMIEPFQGSIYARLKLDLGVYATRNGALRLEYRGAEPVLYPPRKARREGNAEDWVIGEGPRHFVEPLDRRRYVLHALEGEDVIAFHLEASVQEQASGPRFVLENASGRTLEDAWLVFDGYGYKLGFIAAGARLEREFIRRTRGVDMADATLRAVLRPFAGIPADMMSPARIMLERRVQELGKGGYPGPGHALLIGYTASPLLPAGTSAAWPRREQALVAFRFAAIPGDDSVGEAASGTPESESGDMDRPESRGVHGAAAVPR